MSRFAGCTRFVYNKGIAWNEEQRNADSNFRISYKALSAQLPIWKENHPWLAETYSQCLQQAMKPKLPDIFINRRLNFSCVSFLGLI